MFDLIMQLSGLLLLLSGLGVGYGLATRPYGGQLRGEQKGMLLLTVLTLAGGFFGAFPWWLDYGGSFAWDLPPLASRLLAAAGWAFALACLLALRHPTQRRLRLIALMLVIYLTPLALAIVGFHLDRFDPAAPITYAFFAIVTLMTLPALWFCWRPVGVVAESQPDRWKPTPLVQGWLGLVALVSGLWGAGIFVTSQGPTALIWAWPQDLLASRLIGVMFSPLPAPRSTAAAGPTWRTLCWPCWWSMDWGAWAVGLWNVLAGKPIPLGYVAVFGVLALGSALGLPLVVAARVQPLASPLSPSSQGKFTLSQ